MQPEEVPASIAGRGGGAGRMALVNVPFCRKKKKKKSHPFCFSPQIPTCVLLLNFTSSHFMIEAPMKGGGGSGADLYG